MLADYIIYGADHSLFTGKVRAYMRYKGFNWEERLASRDVYLNIILPNVGAPIIPILETADGQYVQDTTDIIDFLENRHPDFSVYPETPVQRLVALLLELYGDEWLLMPAMHYRWSVIEEQHDFVMTEFGRSSAPNASIEEQVAIGERISKPFSGMLPGLGVTEDTIPGIEITYLALLDQLEQHFSEFDFLLGTRPSIGDCGLLGPLYAHLGRDPVPKALMQQRAPNVYAWVERMNQPEPRSGQFLAHDVIPDTLLPILKTMCRDQLPDILDVIEHNSAWLEKNPGGNIPRFLGMHLFTTGPATGKRFISSYAQWLFQRAWLHYQSLDGDAKVTADTFLISIGGYAGLNIKIHHWLDRRAGQLELVEGQLPHV